MNAPDYVAKQDFVQAMGQHVASVCVITTIHEGQRYGLTATAVASVSADPPRVLVCVNKSGATHDKIIASGVFCVNVLAERQENIGKAFAGMIGKDFDRFSLGHWRELATGSPTLKDAAAVFDCRIAHALDQTTHTIIIGDVVGVDAATKLDALVYGARHFHTLRKVAAQTADEYLSF